MPASGRSHQPRNGWKSRWLGTLIWPVLALGFFAGCQTSRESQEPVGKNREGTLFYLEEKKFVTATRRAAVILKMIPEKGGREFRGVQAYLEQQQKVSKDFQYIRGTFEMDCPSGLMRVVRTDYYNGENRIIVSNQYENTLWGKVPFESVGFRIRQMVCPPS